MTAKEYLGNIRRYDKQISRRLQRIQELNNMIGLTATDYSRDRVQTSPSNSGMTRIPEQIVDLEMEIAERLERKKKIIQQIEDMSNTKHSEVLYAIYVNGSDFFQLQDELNLSYFRVAHLHSSALADFADKYDLANFSKD